MIKTFIFTMAAAALLTSPVLSETRIFVDDADRSVELELPIKSAVVFNRYAVEFVRAVGGSDRIVGVDASTMRAQGYFPEYDDTMIVGAGQTEPNYEAIVALQPDLVIMPRNGVYEEAAAQLEPFGIPVMVITAWDTLQHVENVTLIGELFGEQDRAEALNDFYSGWMSLLSERLEGVDRRRVYLEETSTTLAEVHFWDSHESLGVIHRVPACGGWQWWMIGGTI